MKPPPVIRFVNAIDRNSGVPIDSGRERFEFIEMTEGNFARQWRRICGQWKPIERWQRPRYWRTA